MHPSLRALLVFSLAAGAASAVACGGNVIVDGAAGATSTGGTQGTGAVTTGFGASTTGSGASATGFGASTTGFGGSVTTTTGFGGSVTTTTGFGGAPSTGACTGPEDEDVFQETVAFPVEAKCALANLGDIPGLYMCLTGNVGLTEPCETCLVNDLQCAVEHCAGPCNQNPESQACASCRQTNCEAAFVACSGQPHDTGITNCATVYGGGPSVTPWQRGLYASDFTTSASWDDYYAYDECACGVGACAGACAGDYCNGQAANPMCGSCLSQGCGMEVAACLAN